MTTILRILNGGLAMLCLLLSLGCCGRSPPVRGTCCTPTECPRRSSANRPEREIRQMLIGESGWTVPWGMYADEEGRLWLNDTYTVSDTPGGTVNMLVTRTDSGYVVDFRKSDHRWTKQSSVYCGDFTPVRVTGICGYEQPEATDGAYLPHDRRQLQLKDMEVGTSAYTVPWAVYPEKKGYSLNGNYSAHETPAGTVKIKVTRTQAGYVVDLRGAKRDQFGSGNYVGDFNPIKVIEVRD